MTRDFAANSSAGKLNLSTSVKELKLSGDVRLRGVYDNQRGQAQAVDPALGGGGVAGNNVGDQQKMRYRIRLRINADYKMTEDWFAGFGLQTTQNNDSGNQTLANSPGTSGDYFQNYNIFISKAFLGWNPTNGVTLIGGKQANPFYTTDLVWDADINPTGFTQRVDLHKMFDLRGLELSAVAGQFVVSDNNESNVGDPTVVPANNAAKKRDAFVYQAQLIAAANVFDGVKLTVAPGYYWSNGAATNGNGGGQGNPAAGTRALDGLKVLLLPGDVSFKIAGKPAKVLWDIAYNQDAADRTRSYGLLDEAGNPVNPTSQDKLAYLLGFQIGENKKKGDWSVLANYRRVGLSAVDPNINDSDWAESYTNMTGYKAGFLYNLGDATSIGATYYVGDNLRKSIGGGGLPVGPTSSSVHVVQLDLNVKF